MTTNFNTDDVVSLRGARVASVGKVSEPSGLQPLPQHGKELPQEEQEAAVDAESLEKAVSMMNDHVQQVHRQLQFSVDKDLDRVVITVIDSDTDEVIRQIPSEEALTLARRFAESADLEIIDHFA